MRVFGSDDDPTDWAAYGREAFVQNWRKRMEKSEAETERVWRYFETDAASLRRQRDEMRADRDRIWEDFKALAEQVAAMTCEREAALISVLSDWDYEPGVRES